MTNHIFMYNVAMELREIIRQIHHLISAKERTSITQLEMSHRIGVKERTYSEYMRGGNSPKGMEALLNLLAQLDDDDIVRVVDGWRNKYE